MDPPVTASFRAPQPPSTDRERISLNLLSLLPALLTLAACAASSTSFTRSGFYLGASAVGAASNFKDYEGADIDDTEFTPGFGARGGYRFSRRFAVEVAYEGEQEFEFHSSMVSVRIQSLTVQGKFYPLPGALQPYVLGGLGYLGADVGVLDIDDEEALWRVGAGLEVYLFSSLPLFTEIDYSVPQGDLDNFEYASAHVGALFRF